MTTPAFLPPPSPEEQMRYFYQTCEARNITLEQAQLYGFSVDVANNVNAEFGIRKNGLFYNELGFRIPYHDFDWNVLIHRETVRRSTPPRDDKGKIQQKYLRRAGIKGSCLYLPYRDDWHDVRQNVRMPIVVVEGEFKTLFLHNIIGELHAVVGLSGAQMFATRDVTGTIHLPDLWDAFDINGREVIFLFDQDRKEVTCQQVHDAMMKAASRIQIQNGKAFTINLAKTEAWQSGEMDKMGIDDYFQEHGGSLKEMWDCREPIPPQKPQYLELRDQWYFCETPQGFIHKDTGQFVKDTSWNSRVMNYIDYVPNKDGVMKEAPAYVEFRKAKDRPTVRGMTFAPEGDKIIDGLFNSWRGWPEHSTEMDKGAVEDFVQAMHTLCGCEEGDRVLDFMAHTFQFPSVRPQHAFLLKSHLTGTGKSTMCRVFKEVAGIYGFKVSGPSFYNHFNAWAKDKLVVWVDEIKSAEMSQNQTTEHLNDFITMPDVTLEPKGVDAYSVPFYARLIMASNDHAPIHMTKTERRTNVIECRDCAGDSDHIRRLQRLNNLTPAGRQAILEWMMERPLDKYNPAARAVINDAARQMMELSRTSAEEYASMFVDICKNSAKEKDGIFYQMPIIFKWAKDQGYSGGTGPLSSAIVNECVTHGILHQCSSSEEQIVMRPHGKGRWISFTGKDFKNAEKRLSWGELPKYG